MELFLQLLFNGLIVGSNYALLGISWGIIFNVTGTFHFAHAIVYTIGAYGAILCTDTLGLPFPVSVAGGILCATVAGVLIEMFIYVPMRRIQATPMTILIASLGILIVVENILPIFFGVSSRSLSGVETQPISLGSVFFTNIHLAQIVCSWGLFILLQLFLHVTRPGKALRAVASNPEMAEAVRPDVCHRLGPGGNRGHFAGYGYRRQPRNGHHRSHHRHHVGVTRRHGQLHR
jgi:branched-chain amino acid transport system permease protein